jgi:hypothetical protein
MAEDTREHKTTTGGLEGEERREFMRALLNELSALERMLAEGMFERGVSRIGSEQEMFLVNRSFDATPAALKVLERLDDPHYTTELGVSSTSSRCSPASCPRSRRPISRSRTWSPTRATSRSTA